MQTSPILIEDDQLRVEAPMGQLLGALGEAIRLELYRAGIEDHHALAMRCLVRAHFRLGDAGLIVRQLEVVDPLEGPG
jgi:hypothetical protein